MAGLQSRWRAEESGEGCRRILSRIAVLGKAEWWAERERGLKLGVLCCSVKGVEWCADGMILSLGHGRYVWVLLAGRKFVA